MRFSPEVELTGADIKPFSARGLGVFFRKASLIFHVRKRYHYGFNLDLFQNEVDAYKFISVTVMTSQSLRSYSDTFLLVTP